MFYTLRSNVGCWASIPLEAVEAVEAEQRKSVSSSRLSMALGMREGREGWCVLILRGDAG